MVVHLDCGGFMLFCKVCVCVCMCVCVLGVSVVCVWGVWGVCVCSVGVCVVCVWVCV